MAAPEGLHCGSDLTVRCTGAEGVGKTAINLAHAVQNLIAACPLIRCRVMRYQAQVEAAWQHLVERNTARAVRCLGIFQISIAPSLFPQLRFREHDTRRGKRPPVKLVFDAVYVRPRPVYIVLSERPVALVDALVEGANIDFQAEATELPKIADFVSYDRFRLHMAGRGCIR